MSNANTENTRAGKYCPRCQTMTVLAQEVCAHCGHRFRTGQEKQALDAPRTDAHTLNRTMQFTLPPLVSRQAPATEQAAAPPRRLGLFIAAALLLLFAVLSTFVYIRQRETAGAAKPSPAGAWETTLASRSSQNARLEFIFREDGSGHFSWATSSGPVRQGQTPLHWRLDADGKLVLTFPASAEADSVSGTLITIFGSHTWLWHLDSAQHRLVIGTLVFQRS